MITFANTFTSYPNGQQNLIQPPDAIMAAGFIPATATSRGQPLPAQLINWLFNKIFKYINRDVVTDSLGVGLFVTDNALIRLEAFDVDNPTRYLLAQGYKAAGAAPVLVELASNTLTLGTPTINGNQPVNGGTNVKIVGYSRQIGEL